MISFWAGLPFLANSACCRPLQIVVPPFVTVTWMGVGVYPVGHDFGMLEHFANGVARRVVLLLPAVSVAAVGDHVRVLVHGGARVGWGVVPGKPTHDVDEPVGSPPARRSCDTRENVEAAAMTAAPAFACESSEVVIGG